MKALPRLPDMAGMMLILDMGEALERVRPPLARVDTKLGLVSPDFSLLSEPKSWPSGISMVPRGDVTVGRAESLSSSMSTSPELRLGSSRPSKPRASEASARLVEVDMEERDDLLRDSETRDSVTRDSRDSVRFCISEMLPFSSERLFLTSGLARLVRLVRPVRPLKQEG